MLFACALLLYFYFLVFTPPPPRKSLKINVLSLCLNFDFRVIFLIAVIKNHINHCNHFKITVQTTPVESRNKPSLEVSTQVESSVEGKILLSTQVENISKSKILFSTRVETFAEGKKSFSTRVESKNDNFLISKNKKYGKFNY
jgi:hypothetical protein